MSVPNELPDIGSTGQRLRQNPRFDPLAAGVGPEEYFVWTRFDGQTTLRDLILMTGLATRRAVEVVHRLRELGAILLPGEKPEQVTVAAPPAPPVEVRTAPATPPPEPDAPEDAAPLAEDVEIAASDRRRILATHRRVVTGDAAAVLGVVDATDRKTVKRAYFTLSKEFHPDRYYGRRTGSFGPRLTAIFEAVTRAYDELTGDRPRRARASSPVASSSQEPVDHAADLFERACEAELAGEHTTALRLFDTVLRLDPQARYLRRAARCALSAERPQIALEYARKAANLEPNNPSGARLLAAAFKGSGKLADAEEVLVMALMIKIENDQLASELQADLAEIRRLVAR